MKVKFVIFNFSKGLFLDTTSLEWEGNLDHIGGFSNDMSKEEYDKHMVSHNRLEEKRHNDFKKILDMLISKFIR